MDGQQDKLPEGCKFVMEIDGQGFRLVTGKWPSKHGQLWNGQLTDGKKVQAAYDRTVGRTFYHGW